MALEIKYFVLKPKGTDDYAIASREAMKAYAVAIRDTDPELAEQLRNWAGEESPVPQCLYDDNRGSRG